MMADIEEFLWKLVAATIFGFLFLPLAVVVVSSFNPAGFGFPPSGFTLEWYGNLLGDSDLIEAFILSIAIGIVTSIVTLPVVVLASLVLRNDHIPNQRLVENTFLFPLMVPEVILGLALLIYFTSVGLGGSVVGIVLAHVMFTTPFALQTILASMKRIDTEIEDAARDLGASRSQTLRLVTVPLIKPAMIAGAGYVFILSFTNVTMTLFLVSTGTITVPVEIYQYISFSIDPTVAAIGSVLILLSTSVVLFIDRIFAVQKVSGF